MREKVKRMKDTALQCTIWCLQFKQSLSNTEVKANALANHRWTRVCIAMLQRHSNANATNRIVSCIDVDKFRQVNTSSPTDLNLLYAIRQADPMLNKTVYSKSINATSQRDYEAASNPAANHSHLVQLNFLFSYSAKANPPSRDRQIVRYHFVKTLVPNFPSRSTPFCRP